MNFDMLKNEVLIFDFSVTIKRDFELRSPEFLLTKKSRVTLSAKLIDFL